MAIGSNSPDGANRQSTRTVDRALALLVEVAENDGLGLVDLARRVGLSPATALRLLRTLEAAEFVRRGDDGSYHGGSRLIQVAVRFTSGEPLYHLAEPHLVALRDELAESAYLGVHGPGSTVMYARLAESERAVRHQSWLGRTVPIEGTAAGTALLGHCGERGYFSTRHTVEDDVTAIAATVYWPDGSIAAAVSVVGPSFRISDVRVGEIGVAVARHARELSARLGAPESITTAGSAPPALDQRPSARR